MNRIQSTPAAKPWFWNHPFNASEGNYVAAFANMGFWILLVILAIRYFRR
jgi:hypothetical protein